MGQEFLKITDPEEVEKIISTLPIRKKMEKNETTTWTWTTFVHPATQERLTDGREENN